MKILIFGGTFNPVHNGHIHMCRAAQDAVCPDMTLIIPTYIPPHKSVESILVGSDDRMQMCRLAFGNLKNTVVSDIEVTAQQKSYTVLTLEKLKKIYDDSEIFMLCGADMFLTLKTWYRYDELIKLATVCVVPRGDKMNEISDYARFVENDGGNCVIINAPTVDISSTEIRRKIASDEDISELVPNTVDEYIKKHNLFR